MNKISNMIFIDTKLPFRIFLFAFLCSLNLIFTSAMIPYVSSFPRDIGKLKGRVKYLFIYDNALSKDSTNKLVFTLSSKTFVAFHKEGNCIVSENFGEKSRIDEYFCNYDKKGNLIEMNICLLTKTINVSTSHYTDKYDSKNREVESTALTNGGTELNKTTYTYTAEGKRVIKYSYNENSVPISIDTLPYNTIDHDFSNFYYPLKRKYKEKEIEEGKGYKKIMLYNKNMDMVESEYYKPVDSLFRKSFCTYDINGNPIAIESFNGNGTLLSKTTHSYTYDKMSNWTTDSIFEQHNLTHIMIRKFEYY